MIPSPSPDVAGWAFFSERDGGTQGEPPRYRYALTRSCGASTPDRPLVICGLNPSTADALKDDQTIRKEKGFAHVLDRRWLVKVNAYAFRATKPPEMAAQRKAGVDVVGMPENDAYISAAAELCREHDGLFLVAWGGNIEPERAVRVHELVVAAGVVPQCLGRNGDEMRSPRHTLYVPYSQPLEAWRPT